MTTVLVVFLIAMATGVIATLLMIRLAWGIGLVDRPDGVRHLHLRTTPRLGGVGVFLGFVIPLLLLFNSQDISLLASTLHVHLREFAGVIVCSVLTLAVGLLDDVFDLRPAWKTLWQILIASVAYMFGFTITAISTPFAGAIHLGGFAYPFTVMWFLICMNAVNLLDGHDGLAAGSCMFVGLTLFLVGMQSQNYLVMLLMAALTGSILGFLFFNFPPAKIFLGDAGSLLLGFLIAVLSLVGSTMKAEAAVALLIPVVAMGLPFFDAAVTILRRWYAGVPISQADRGHIHHILSSMGLGPRGVVFLLYGVTLMMCAIAMILTFVRNEIVILVIGALVIAVFVSIRVFTGLGPVSIIERLMDDQVRRKQMMKSKMSLERAIVRMQAARDLRELWSMCSETLDEVGVNCAKIDISINLCEKGGKDVSLSWTAPRPEEEPGHPPDSWLFKLPIVVHDRNIGSIVFENCACGGDAVGMREMPALLRRMRDGLTFHITRLIDHGLA